MREGIKEQLLLEERMLYRFVDTHPRDLQKSPVILNTHEIITIKLRTSEMGATSAFIRKRMNGQIVQDAENING